MAWVRRAAELTRAVLRGPCASCATSCSAPFCASCREASLVGSWRARLIDGDVFFAGSFYRGANHALSPLGLAMRSFKDRGDRHAGRCLAALFTDTLANLVQDADIVIAVPSDLSRVRERGLAPAAWLARALAARLRVPLGRDALRRNPGHPPQRGLDGTARRLNAARAFALGPTRVAGYTVVLVDDVATTGATLAATSRLLREAGASHVRRAVAACADEDVVASCRPKTAIAGKKGTVVRPR